VYRISSGSGISHEPARHYVVFADVEKIDDVKRGENQVGIDGRIAYRSKYVNYNLLYAVM